MVAIIKQRGKKTNRAGRVMLDRLEKLKRE
jgi:hypothetical protein